MRTRREPISQFRSSDRRTRAPTMGGGAVTRGAVRAVSHKTFFLHSIILGFMAPLADRKRHKDANKWTFKCDPSEGFFYFFFWFFFSPPRGNSTITPPKFKKHIFSVFCLPFYIRVASLNFNYNILPAPVCIRVTTTAAISKGTYTCERHSHSYDKPSNVCTYHSVPLMAYTYTI